MIDSLARPQPDLSYGAIAKLHRSSRNATSLLTQRHANARLLACDMLQANALGAGFTTLAAKAAPVEPPQPAGATLRRKVQTVRMPAAGLPILRNGDATKSRRRIRRRPSCSDIAPRVSPPAQNLPFLRPNHSVVLINLGDPPMSTPTAGVVYDPEPGDDPNRMTLTAEDLSELDAKDGKSSLISALFGKAMTEDENDDDLDEPEHDDDLDEEDLDEEDSDDDESGDDDPDEDDDLEDEDDDLADDDDDHDDEGMGDPESADEEDGDDLHDDDDLDADEVEDEDEDEDGDPIDEKDDDDDDLDDDVSDDDADLDADDDGDLDTDDHTDEVEDDDPDENGRPDHVGSPAGDPPGRARAEEARRDLRLDRDIDDGELTGELDLDLFGNGRDNALRGNAGNNVLFGAGGDDEMTGGAGADVFAFASIGRGQSGRIKDFDHDDKIALDDQFFSIGDATVNVRQVSPGQLLRAVELGLISYDARSGEVHVAGLGDDPLLAIEGGGRIDLDDVLLF
ncbi:hypothetical protein [Jannaschia formosa]|uniref:hypothetical protein n=1 Tax=Jannaschia formosa TaxID=2259592 RepID=UPI001074F0C1|nr:hypothetical protein [Jannaschia formosa]TFL15986.1 hypothetical protein DR046_22425 [Jannaschia formosa]